MRPATSSFRILVNPVITVNADAIGIGLFFECPKRLIELTPLTFTRADFSRNLSAKNLLGMNINSQ